MRKKNVVWLLLCAWTIYSHAAEWQWSVPVSKVIASETGGHPQAFLWIPEDCMQVRAVMIGTHNMCEETLFENELFRRGMKEAGVALIWITPDGTSSGKRIREARKLIGRCWTIWQRPADMVS